MTIHTSTVPFFFICVLSVWFGALLVHHGWIYYQLVQISTPSLNGRYSGTVLCIIALGSAFFLVYQPFLAICDITQINHKQSVYLIHNLLAQSTAIIYPFLIAYRSWMIYYQIKWNIAMEDTEWSRFIDTHSNRNWFLRHYEFNKKYTWRLFAAVWFMLEIPTLFVTFIGEKQYNLLALLYGIQFFCPVLFLAVLLCKIPKYEDVFFIRAEIRLILAAYLTMAALYVPAIMMPVVLQKQTGIIVLKFYAFIMPFFIVYAHLYFPFKTFRLPQTLCALQQYREELLLKQVDSIPAGSGNTNMRTEKLTLRTVLSSTDGFNAFARHVNKEFAIENILFLLEVHQFQRKMVEIFGKDQLEINDDANGLNSVCFPESVPKSTLMLNMNRENVHQCLAELFMKYVVDDGYFTINIAYESRAQLYELFAYSKHQSHVDVLSCSLQENVSTEWNRLYHIFDDQKAEIYRLLSSSFCRFQKSSAYARLLSVQHASSVNLGAIGVSVSRTS